MTFTMTSTTELSQGIINTFHHGKDGLRIEEVALQPSSLHTVALCQQHMTENCTLWLLWVVITHVNREQF